MTVGLVLAAGRGSRMGTHTQNQPKCLTQLAGRSLMDWQLGALRAAGVARAVVIGGYHSEALAGELELLVAERWSETNMVRTLMVADSLLASEVVIVSYSDIVFHPDHVRALLGADGLAITYDTKWLELWSLRFDDPLSDAETFRLDGSAVTEIAGEPQDVRDVQGQFMGLLRFEPDAWRRVRAQLEAMPPEIVDALDMTGLLARLIANQVTVTGVPVAGRWCEVDSRSDLNLYSERLDSASPWVHDWRWVED